MSAVAIANSLACRGLDQIEKTLPILHQPSEQVRVGPDVWRNHSLSTADSLPESLKILALVQIVSSARDVVTTVTGTVAGAKDTVSDTLTTAVGKTRDAVQGGVDKTRAVVSERVNTVLESRVARLVSSGVDSALSTSESLVDQYLPRTEHELGERAAGGLGLR